MNIRIIAASVLALGLMAPIAMAADGVAGSEVNNRRIDYPTADVSTYSTKAFSAAAVVTTKRATVGDYVDETNEEKNQRSSNR